MAVTSKSVVNIFQPELLLLPSAPVSESTVPQLHNVCTVDVGCSVSMEAFFSFSKSWIWHIPPRNSIYINMLLQSVTNLPGSGIRSIKRLQSYTISKLLWRKWQRRKPYWSSYTLLRCINSNLGGGARVALVPPRHSPFCFSRYLLIPTFLSGILNENLFLSGLMVILDPAWVMFLISSCCSRRILGNKWL